MTRHALSMVLIASSAAFGQSTAALGAFEPRTTYQISAGANSHVFPLGYAGDTRSAVALDLSVHRATPGVMTIRADAWLIDRTSVNEHVYVPDGFGYDPAAGQSYSLQPKRAWLLAAVISGSFPVHVAPDFVIGPMFGVGVVPVARGSFTKVITSQSGSRAEAQITRSARGWLLATGICLRWRHFVIEQHILQVTGADQALSNGENSPFTIGWRF